MQDDLLKTDADFVVSESLTTPGAGYNSLHHWLGRTIPPAKPTPCKFKLSKISRKIYEKNSGLKVPDSHVALNSSSTSIKKEKKSKEDLDKELRSYYKSVSKQDKLSSQTTLSPDQSNHSSIDTPIAITTHARLISKELNSKSTPSGKQCIPSRFEILKTSGFGKPDSSHSFTSEACFEHTLLHLLKSDFLSPQDEETVFCCHPLFKHLHRMMTWSKTVDFSTLKNPIVNFSEQKHIASSRVKQFLAAALHYDLDLPTVIRSLRGNYTGEYRDTSFTLKALRDAHCDEVIISDVKRTLLTGCPNKMNAPSTHSKFLEFTRYSNHTTVKKNLDQVLKTLNKEDRN